MQSESYLILACLTHREASCVYMKALLQVICSTSLASSYIAALLAKLNALANLRANSLDRVCVQGNVQHMLPIGRCGWVLLACLAV